MLIVTRGYNSFVSYPSIAMLLLFYFLYNNHEWIEMKNKPYQEFKIAIAEKK